MTEDDETRIQESHTAEHEGPHIPAPERQGEPGPVDYDHQTSTDLATTQGGAIGSPPRQHVTPAEDVHFTYVDAGPLSEHVISDYAFDGLSYGAGGGLADIDGDGDLDVFMGSLGGSGSLPCWYENASVPGEIRFVPIEGECEREDILLSAYPIDVENDGTHEALILGRNIVELHRFSPVREVIDLIADLPEGVRCQAGAAESFDIDLDGDLDIVVACPPWAEPERGLVNFDDNIVLVRDGDSFSLATGTQNGLFRANDNTLAYAIHDVDDNGLLDIMIVNDTFSRAGRRNTRYQPGGLGLRCAPGDPCTWRLIYASTDLERWASFMGAGTLYIEGVGSALFMADWGQNRVLQLLANDDGPPTFTNLSEQLWLGGSVDLPLFSWGIVVDDFNFDGLDDVFVSQGDVLFRNDFEVAWHRSTVYLQRLGEPFLAVADEVGLGTGPVELRSHGPVSASRAAVKVDLDQDGTLEIIVNGFRGHPVILREQAVGPRCTLRVRSTVVPGFGYGVAVGESVDTLRVRDLRGTFQFGASPWVVTSHTSGFVRYPSGWVEPFDCGDSAAIDLLEPDWLQLEEFGGSVTASITEALQSSAAITALTFHPGNTVVDGASAVVPDGAESVMVQLDGRWVGRRWLLAP